MARRPRASTYYRKRERYWTVRWREPSGQQVEEGGYQTEGDADDRAREVARRLREGLPGVRAPRTVAEIAAEWWEKYVLAGKVEPATRVSYKTAMRRILDSIGERDAGALTTATLVEWHASLGVSPRAANIALTALSSLLQRSVEWGYIDTNPARGVKRHREPRVTVTIPTPSDIDRLAMTAPTERDRGLLMVACYAGLRQSELYALDVADLLTGGRLRVAGPQRAGGQRATKTRVERVVPIPAPVAEWLEDWTAGRPGGEPMFLSDTGARILKDVWRRKTWYAWTEAAGCEGLLWRHLRHYYASQLASVGASLAQCSRWMGHATVATTIDRYTFLFDHDEKRVMADLASAGSSPTDPPHA